MSGRRGGPPDIHLYDIERIEVLRGPEGTYYGASAVSGTVRIITKQPNPEGFEYGVDLTGGTISDGDTAYTSGARVDPLPQEWWSCPGWKYEDYSSALFGDVSWDFTDRLTVSASTRYFRWEDGEKERSYKFNVRYDLSEDLLVYFAYGEGLRPGFRNPNVTHAEVPMFVEADYTKSYEVGWKSTLADGRVTLNGAVYMIDWDNFQTALYDLLTVPFEFRRNVEGPTIQGVEFDLLARINVNCDLVVHRRALEPARPAERTGARPAGRLLAGQPACGDELPRRRLGRGTVRHERHRRAGGDLPELRLLRPAHQHEPAADVRRSGAVPGVGEAPVPPRPLRCLLQTREKVG